MPNEPSDLDLDVLAGLVLAADLVPRPAGPLWSKVRLVLTAAVGLVMESENATEASGALVVTRLDNRATVRLTRSNWEDGELLAYVRQQLAELTAGDFLDRWGVDPAVLRDGPGGQDGSGPRGGSEPQDGSR